MKENESSFQNVKSTKNCAIGTTYRTTNYKMFKFLKFNRGADNSIIPLRVAAFKKLYEEGNFYEDICHVLINLSDELCDGHHKLTMAEAIGIPVNFQITAQPQFNSPNLSDKLNAISKYNAMSSKWDGRANFDSAVQTKEPLALAILKMQGELNIKYGINPKMLTASRIVAIIKCNEIGLAGKSLEREAYCSKETLKVMQIEKFKTEMEFVCNVIKYVLSHNERNPEITPFYVIRNIMPNVWNSVANMKWFYHNMVKMGFKDVGNTMKKVGKRVEEMSAKKLHKDVELITW